MYKTLIVPLKCSIKDHSYLNKCNKESAIVWNKILEVEKEHRALSKEWITQNQLQKALKGCAELHSKGIQQVILRYIHARQSTLKAKQGKGDTNKYPHRNKQFVNTIWDYQVARVKDDHILLSKASKNVDGKRKRQNPVKCYVKNIPDNIVQVELMYKDKLYLSIKYKEQSDYIQIQSTNHAAIDLGEIHAITSIDSCGNAIIITGRKVRSIKQLRNKQQAKLRRKISKTVKGSKQNLKLRKALVRLNHKSERQIKDATHKISKLYVDYCIENNISTVYYGDLDSATRNIKKRFKGTKVTQKLKQWNYGQLIRCLEKKLNMYDIQMVKVKEYYTSQTCPSCTTRHKPTGREYRCICGYVQHRDIVGSINILNQNAGTQLTHYKYKKYLRIA